MGFSSELRSVNRGMDGDTWFGFVLALAETSGTAGVGVEVLVGGRLVAHRIC